MPQPADTPALAFRDCLDIEPALEAIPRFLTWLSDAAPPILAAASRALAGKDADAWRSAVAGYVAHETGLVDEMEPAEAFVVSAVLQPFAERLGRAWPTTSPAADAGLAAAAATCRLCSGWPILGVLREEGQGARRALVCSFCLSEGDYRRVLCPSCGEEKFDALPVYTAEQFAHIRVEACDNCRTYLKTIDVSRDGLAVPLVDDLASVAMDLWARERGYSRLCPNLLRV
jgi:FdhE protein